MSLITLMDFHCDTVYLENSRKTWIPSSFEKADATHLISEVIIGSSLNVIVEYERSSQENKVEIESFLSESLRLGSSKLMAQETHISQLKVAHIRNENLRILLKGSMKKNVSLSNVSTILK